jgi:hypothetical protein
VTQLTKPAAPITPLAPTAPSHSSAVPPVTGVLGDQADPFSLLYPHITLTDLPLMPSEELVCLARPVMVSPSPQPKNTTNRSIDALQKYARDFRCYGQ